MAPDIWTPDSAQHRPRFQCRICKDRFETDTVYEQHVVACGREHEHDLYELAQEKKRYHAAPDPEWEKYNLGLIAQGIDPDVQFSRLRKRGIRRASES